MTPPIKPEKPDLSATLIAQKVEQRLRADPPRSTRSSSTALIVGTVKSFGEAFVHVLVGAVFMAGGIWLIAYAIQHPTSVVVNGVTTQSFNKLLLYGGGGATLFGALLMPTILPLVKQIIVVIVPYIPMLGGRRATDPPAEKP